jgi:hypothetical protein
MRPASLYVCDVIRKQASRFPVPVSREGADMARPVLAIAMSFSHRKGVSMLVNDRDTR